MGAKTILCRALAALLAATLLGTALPLSAFAQQPEYPEYIEACEEQAEYRLADAVVWNADEADEPADEWGETFIALPSTAADPADQDAEGDEPRRRRARRTRARSRWQAARRPRCRRRWRSIRSHSARG